MKCRNCGSENIEKGIIWSLNTHQGEIGLTYKTRILLDTSRVYSDLCLECGEVLRTYIKDSPKYKDWCK